MSILISGRVSALLLLLVMFLAIYLSMREATRKVELPYIRRVAALDAIDEAIERSAEMNRPILASYGLAYGTRAFSPQTLAALSIVGYAAKMTARTGADFIVPAGGASGSSIAYPQAIEIVRSAYDEEGKLADFQEEYVRFLSESQWAFTLAQIGIMHDENIGAAIYGGGVQGPELIALCEEAKSVGAMVISAGSLMHLCATAITSDYILIGEEQLAAGAYLSKDRLQIGTIRGQDWCKFITALLIIMGVITITAGYTVILDILQL